MRLISILVLVGCAHTHVTHRRVDRYESPTIVGHAEPLALEASIDGDRLRVRAQHPRRCYREVHETDEATRQKVGDPLDFGGRQDTGDAALGVVLAVLTSAQLLADHPTTKLEDHLVDTLDEPCPLPDSNEIIEVELPSGATLQGTTDLAGEVELVLPGDEHGTVTVRAGDASATAIR